MKTLAIAIALSSMLAAGADRELDGKVVDAATGEPVTHAHLTLHFYAAGQAPEVLLLTDSDGSFKITNPPDGGFQLTCEKAGYLTLNRGMPGIQPGDSNNPSPVVIRLTSQAALEGTVVDDRDVPMENTFIQVVRQQLVNGRRQFVVTNGGNSDETGYFRLFGLAAGRYYIAISARVNGVRRSKSLAYPQLYFPNVPDLASAQPIDLKAGDERQIKIKLPEPSPAYNIRGVVATGAQGVGIELVRQNSGGPTLPGNTETNWDPKTSSFRIFHVTPGTYTLTAHVHDGRKSLEASTTVTVGSDDVSGIRLEPIASGLEGTIHIEGDPGPQRPVPFVNVAGRSGGGGAPVDPDGKFQIANLSPDTYRIQPTIPNPQWCVRSILQGGRDVGDGLTIAAGVLPAPVDITVTTHCGGMDATITPPDSSTPVNLTAMLMRKVGEEYVLAKQSYVRVVGGQAAPHVVMQGLTPGDYVLFAWSEDAEIEYANPDAMRPIESYGQSVTVTEGAKATVTLDKVLIPSRN